MNDGFGQTADSTAHEMGQIWCLWLQEGTSAHGVENKKQLHQLHMKNILTTAAMQTWNGLLCKGKYSQQSQKEFKQKLNPSPVK